MILDNMILNSKRTHVGMAIVNWLTISGGVNNAAIINMLTTTYGRSFSKAETLIICIFIRKNVRIGNWKQIPNPNINQHAKSIHELTLNNAIVVSLCMV